MDPRSLACWPRKNRVEIIPLHIYHCARGIIHRACNHSRKWKRYIMIGSDILAPLVILEPLHPFPGKGIGISSAETVRFISTMKIYKHVMFSSFTGSFVIEIDHLLIVPLHKIDFNSLYTPFFILG